MMAIWVLKPLYVSSTIGQAASACCCGPYKLTSGKVDDTVVVRSRVNDCSLLSQDMVYSQLIYAS